MHKWIKAVHVVAGEVGGTVQYGYRGRGCESDCIGIVCEDTRACIDAGARLELVGASVEALGAEQIVFWPWLTSQPVDNA